MNLRGTPLVAFMIGNLVLAIIGLLDAATGNTLGWPSWLGWLFALTGWLVALYFELVVNRNG